MVEQIKEKKKGRGDFGETERGKQQTCIAPISYVGQSKAPVIQLQHQAWHVSSITFDHF